MLENLKVIELGGAGPVPYCGMLLADYGADVIRIDRADGDPHQDQPGNIMMRGKRFIGIDLKDPAGLDIVKKLIGSADIVLDSFRPGVLERLGLDPEQLLQTVPWLVFARMSGWGQTGPMARAPGHDINYLALCGALHGIGDADRPPPPPIAYVGDMGGGAILAFAVLSAATSARATGQGRIVDASIYEAAMLLAGPFHALAQTGGWSDTRATNAIDGSAPFYRCYACADGRYVAVGALEDQFFAKLLELLELPASYMATRWDTAVWPKLTEEIAGRFGTKSRDGWVSDVATAACVSPVLTLAESMEHPQATERSSFVPIAGVRQPRPFAGLCETPGAPPTPAAYAREILSEAGYEQSQIERLSRSGTVLL